MNMQDFLAKVVTDQALAEKLKNATGPDNAYAIAKEAGLTDSFETFVDTMKKLNDAAGDMNAAEVDNITGGSDTTDMVVVSLTAASIVSAQCAASVAIV